MNTQINLLSDDELDIVVGGMMNNGIGQSTLAHNTSAGALPFTGDMGTGNHGTDVVSGLLTIGVLALGIFGAGHQVN